MQLAAPVAAHGLKADAFGPVKLIPGVVQQTVDKQRSLMDQCTNVFTLAKAHVKLCIGRGNGVFKHSNGRLLAQRFAKPALVKKEQRAGKVGRLCTDHGLKGLLGAFGQNFYAVGRYR